MKIKSKAAEPNATKLIGRHSTSLSTGNVNVKPKTTFTFQKPLIKTKSKSNFNKSEDFGKQNKQSANIPSPQDKLKGKNYKPQIKKMSRLQMSHNTVSLVINQSNISTKKTQLLDSLLYGQGDLSYSQDFTLNTFKDSDNDQLLIDNCDHTLNFNKYKNLSPIKSISQYSITQSQDLIFVAQKLENNSANITLRIKDLNIDKQDHKFNCVLLRRLLIHFTQKSQRLLNFYTLIHKASTKLEFQLKLREYLFQNAIIFNKSELNQFVQGIQKILKDSKYSHHRHAMLNQYCELKYEIMMEKIFLILNSKNQASVEKLWVSQETLDKLFEERDIVSVWKLVSQIAIESHKDIQNSFRQSRFCMSTESSQFLHQTDLKRKQQSINLIAKWLSNFIRPLPEFSDSKKIAADSQEIIIKITPPQLN